MLACQEPCREPLDQTTIRNTPARLALDPEAQCCMAGQRQVHRPMPMLPCTSPYVSMLALSRSQTTSIYFRRSNSLGATCEGESSQEPSSVPIAAARVNSTSGLRTYAVVDAVPEVKVLPRAVSLQMDRVGHGRCEHQAQSSTIKYERHFTLPVVSALILSTQS